MTIRADARLDIASGKLAVAVIMTDMLGGNPKMYRLGGRVPAGELSGAGWINIDEGVKVDPTFTVPVETAELIMEALIKHFGPPKPPEPVTDWHAAYIAERERVDKLLDVVVALADN